MFLIYRLHLFLYCLSELNRSMNGTRAAVSVWWEIDENTEFMEWLQATYPKLVDQLKYNVMGAKDHAEGLDKIVVIEEQKLTLIAMEDAKANAVLRTKCTWIEWGMGLDYAGIATEFFRFVLLPVGQGSRRHPILALRDRDNLVIYFGSSWLGVLNFISAYKMLDLDFGMITPESLVLLPLTLLFSISTSISIHLGLCSFITATRLHDAGVARQIHDNLFPYGWKDKAIWISAVLLIVDTLFSAVGLMSDLSPSMKRQLFWQVCIVAMSGFGALINLILVWGVAIERIQHNIRFKLYSTKLREMTETIETVVIEAAHAAQQLKMQQQVVSRCKADALMAWTEAKESFWRWYKELQNKQREEHIKGMWMALFGPLPGKDELSNGYQDKPKLEGRRKR